MYLSVLHTEAGVGSRRQSSPKMDEDGHGAQVPYGWVVCKAISACVRVSNRPAAYFEHAQSRPIILKSHKYFNYFEIFVNYFKTS